MERQFILVNKKNEELSFNSSDIFGHTPEGLGMEIEGTTYQAYNSFNDMVLTVKQNEISLKLTLGNDSRKPYATYMYLLKFLNVGGLVLRYIVPDVGTFERKIALRSLSKKDMDLYSVLQEEIKFAAMTPWYSWVTLSKNFDRVFNAGRIWDDSRIYQTKYAYSWSNTGLSGTETYAYAYNKTGTDRFTLLFPMLNLLDGTRDYTNFPNVSETYYKRTIVKTGGINNSPYIQQSNTNPASGFKDVRWTLPLANIKPSTRYTFSFYIRGSGKIQTYVYPSFTDTTANLSLADGLPITATVDGNYEWTLTSDWVKHTYTFTSKSSLTAAQNALFRLFNGNTADICLPKLEEGNIATPWMPTDSESLVTDFPMYLGKAYINNDESTPTDPKSYVWIQSDLTSPVQPVVYRGDFTREFPRLNLLNGTKDFSGDWANSDITITDGTYKGLTVKKKTGQWGGIYKTFTVIENSDYTFSAFVKADCTNANIVRVVIINGVEVNNLEKIWTSSFDWVGDSITFLAKDIKVGDKIIVRYEISAVGTNLALWTAGHKWEPGPTATPWMPSVSEVTQDDYPSYLGTYSGLGNPDLDDPLMYSWNRYNYTTGVDANIIPDPTFMTNPPLLSNTESKKIGDTWQVFNTGTNVGSVVTKESDGLKLVNMGGNTLYLRPNQVLPLVSNNEYRLEYDITVSSVSSSNDMYIVFTNQSQLPNYIDVIDPNNPYIKIPLTGEVTTNLDVVFNPIAVRNVQANTKCRRIIDFTVPAGYQFGIIQAVNSNQSTTIYNNFELSYPTETINEPANGPYSIISPKTNIYQIDYSRAASYLEIDNDSMYFGTQSDSSLRMVIKATPTTGRIDNPSWYLTDDAGNKIQTEGFLTGIPVGYELVVSSDPFERYMVLRDSSGNLPDTEIDQFIDPMVTGWIRVPVGISKLVLSDALYSATGGFNAGSVSLEYKKEWVIV